jgi:Domain of unknown function (DUF4160)
LEISIADVLDVSLSGLDCWFGYSPRPDSLTSRDPMLILCLESFQLCPLSFGQVRIGSFSTPAIATNRSTSHVERDEHIAKFWLDPVILQSSGGFRRSEINRIQKLVEENQETLLERWNEFFSS